MAVSSFRKQLDILILLVVLVLGFLAYKNAVAIGDWWHGFRYNPDYKISQLADDAGMNNLGKKLFFRYSPEFVSATELSKACGNDHLGCAEGVKIYILNGSSSAEHNRSIVTASHEMLHIAYSRLIKDKKDSVDFLLKKQIAKYPDQDVMSQLETIDQADYYNEAHSYIGSQQPKLLPELETYYKKYFDERTKTIDAYQASPES